MFRSVATQALDCLYSVTLRVRVIMGKRARAAEFGRAQKRGRDSWDAPRRCVQDAERTEIQHERQVQREREHDRCWHWKVAERCHLKRSTRF